MIQNRLHIRSTTWSSYSESVYLNATTKKSGKKGQNKRHEKIGGGLHLPLTQVKGIKKGEVREEIEA